MFFIFYHIYLLRQYEKYKMALACYRLIYLNYNQFSVVFYFFGFSLLVVKDISWLESIRFSEIFMFSFEMDALWSRKVFLMTIKAAFDQLTQQNTKEIPSCFLNMASCKNCFLCDEFKLHSKVGFFESRKDMVVFILNVILNVQKYFIQFCK